MNLKTCLNLWREPCALLLYMLCDKQLQTDITLDAQKIAPKKRNLESLCIALLNDPFRNIFYYRMNSSHRALREISKVFLPPVKSVEINGGTFGGGLQIVHNNCVIHANKVGTDFKVGPGVVIGKNNNGWPTIGDNVYIAANATVIGPVTIGDNSIIGAGAVVTRNVPENSVYVGNPAVFLRDIAKQ